MYFYYYMYLPKLYKGQKNFIVYTSSTLRALIPQILDKISLVLENSQNCTQQYFIKHYTLMDFDNCPKELLIFIIIYPYNFPHLYSTSILLLLSLMKCHKYAARHLLFIITRFQAMNNINIIQCMPLLKK